MEKLTYRVYVIHEKSQYPDLTDYLNRSDICWLEVYQDHIGMQNEKCYVPDLQRNIQKDLYTIAIGKNRPFNEACVNDLLVALHP